MKYTNSWSRVPSVMAAGLMAAGVIAVLAASTKAQDVRGKSELREQLDDLELKGTWYYDDLSAAREEARRTGKPLFVVLRCPP